MRKTLTISGIECNFKSSAAIPRMYRLKFGRDVFVDMQKLQKQVALQEKIKKNIKKLKKTIDIKFNLIYN